MRKEAQPGRRRAIGQERGRIFYFDTAISHTQRASRVLACHAITLLTNPLERLFLPAHRQHSGHSDFRRGVSPINPAGPQHHSYRQQTHDAIEVIGIAQQLPHDAAWQCHVAFKSVGFGASRHDAPDHLRSAFTFVADNL
jgi:hypothetical protein